MADLSQFLAGGKPLKTVGMGGDTVAGGNSGTVVTIIPAADQYALVTLGYSGAAADIHTIAVGGSTVYSGAINIVAGMDVGSYDFLNQNNQIMGGKGEAITVSRVSSVGQPLLYSFQFLEES